MSPRSEASGPDLAGGKFVAGHGHPEHPGGVAGQDAQRRRRRRQHRSPADDKTMPDVAGGNPGPKGGNAAEGFMRTFGTARERGRKAHRQSAQKARAGPSWDAGRDGKVGCGSGRRPGPDGLGSGGSGIGPGTDFSGQGAGCGRLRAGQQMRSLAKTWSLDFSLIRQPSPATCLQPAREIGGDRDSCSMTKYAWPKVVRGQSFHRVISGC